jgi:transcriptional regulator with XRE-family HTH domain
LSQLRKGASIRQQALAKKLGRPRSFIAKNEGGERRNDGIEFIAIARAPWADPLFGILWRESPRRPGLAFRCSGLRRLPGLSIFL